jgi:type II secretory pathway component PulF
LPIFKYIASDKAGKVQAGQMEAIDQKTVVDYLKNLNLLVVSVKKKEADQLNISLSRHVSVVDKINLTGNLAIMLKSGVSISEALQIIGDDSSNTYFRQIINDIRFGIENGRSLSQGLAGFKKDFNPVFVSLVKSGETSGQLEETLLQLNLQLKKEYALISKVKSALAYPTILIGGLIFVVVLLMVFVLPRLVSIFASSNLKLPLTTKIIFAVSQFLAYKPYLTIAVFIILIVVLIFLAKQKFMRNALNWVLLRLPISSNLLNQIELVRFARTLGNLLKSGVAIGPALEITADGLNLSSFSRNTQKAKESVLKGVSLANAFKGNNDFPNMLISVMKVGEKTGELDVLLLNLADFYEEQADNTLKSLSSLIEPILLIIVGLGIGGIALSIILPVYQLIGSF